MPHELDGVFELFVIEHVAGAFERADRVGRELARDGGRRIVGPDVGQIESGMFAHGIRRRKRDFKVAVSRRPHRAGKANDGRLAYVARAREFFRRHRGDIIAMVENVFTDGVVGTGKGGQ